VVAPHIRHVETPFVGCFDIPALSDLFKELIEGIKKPERLPSGKESKNSKCFAERRLQVLSPNLPCYCTECDVAPTLRLTGAPFPVHPRLTVIEGRTLYKKDFKRWVALCAIKDDHNYVDLKLYEWEWRAPKQEWKVSFANYSVKHRSNLASLPCIFVCRRII
jgi:hypothetical protein